MTFILDETLEDVSLNSNINPNFNLIQNLQNVVSTSVVRATDVRSILLVVDF